MGYWFQGTSEPILLGTKGKHGRIRTGAIGALCGVQRQFYAPAMGHSIKHETLHDYAEEHLPGPYAELFARRERPGWDCFGLELGWRLSPKGPVECEPLPPSEQECDAALWCPRRPDGHVREGGGMRELRAIDLCGGAGGWAVAARGLPIRITHAVDWWPPAVRTYRLNHPEVLVIRADCREIPLKPEGFDLVLGGIPCQWLSHLRSIGLGNPPKPEEIERERALLDSILGWVKQLDPPYWCLEDVKQILTELPPFTPYHVIDAQQFSGQRRVRAYVGDFPRPKPAMEGDPRLARDYLRPGPHRVHPKNLDRFVSRHNTWQSKDNVYPIEADRKFPTVVTVGSRHDSKSVVLHPKGMAIRPAAKFPTVLNQHRHDAEHAVLDESGTYRRQVEWTEAALAQGFPEDYVFVGNQSDVSQMVANAIQIDTGRAILKAICSADAVTSK